MTMRSTSLGTQAPRGARALVRSTRYLGSFPRLQTDAWAMRGQDGGQSIDLGDGRTLFLFSDTLLTARVPSHTLRDASGPAPLALDGGTFFLANNAGLAPTGPGVIRSALGALVYYADADGFPRQVLSPGPEDAGRMVRFWPEHGVALDGQVYLFYLGIETVGHDSIWEFRNLGSGLAVLDPATGCCTPLHRDGTWLLWPRGGDVEDAHVGVQVLRQDGYLYVFGSTRRRMVAEASVMRVPLDAVTDRAAYEYLAAPGLHESWNADPALACSMGPAGDHYSVSYNPYLDRYVMLYVDGYAKTLMLRTAESITGPYSTPERVVALPHEASSELIYLAFEHPMYRENDGQTIYVSYSQPHFVSNALVTLRFR